MELTLLKVFKKTSFLLFFFILSNLVSQKKLTDTNGTPRFISFKNEQQHKLKVSLKNDKEILNHYLPLSNFDQYKTIDTKIDSYGIKHITYQQYYQNIKVEFGTFTIHKKNNNLKSLTGNFIKVKKNIFNKKRISEKEALKFALKNINGKGFSWKRNNLFFKDPKFSKIPKAEIVICKDFKNLNNKDAYVSYKFTVATTDPFSITDIFINAENGTLLLKNPRVHLHDHTNCSYLKKHEKSNSPNNTLTTGNADTKYHGKRTIETDAISSGYRLYDTTRGAGIHTKNAKQTNQSSILEKNFDEFSEFIDTNNNWETIEWDNENSDIAALDVHWGTGLVYDYYKNTHGRKSYDDKDSPLKSLVHVGFNYRNAFWYDGTMYYGDGSSGEYPLTTIDVITHEITHGVTQESADLIYYSESGAINEAISDIFAATVKLKKVPTKNPWVINIGDLNIRSLSNPNEIGSPDTYKGRFWTGEDTSDDSRGVHTNSGVLNYWFYLITAGGSGTNDDGFSYNVKPIGIDDAEKIVYRMLTIYLEPTSDYLFTKHSGIQAAEDLFGISSFQKKQVIEAFKAVGINNSKSTICESLKKINIEFSGHKKITFNWEYPKGEDNGDTEFVYLRYKAEKEDSFTYDSLESGNEYTFLREYPNQKYTIEVKRSCNVNWTSIIVDAAIDCGEVKNLRIINKDNTNNTMELVWDAISDAKVYKVISGSRDFSFPLEYTNATSAVVKFNPKTIYEQKFSVIANCSSKETSINMEANYKTPSIEIISPTNNETTDTSFDVKFNVNMIEPFPFESKYGTGINYYLDDKKIGIWESTFSPIQFNSLTSGEHTIKLVLTFLFVEYILTPNTSASIKVFVKDKTLSTLKSEKEITNFNVYPNPFSTTVSIVSPKDTPIETINIYNIVGQKINTIKHQNTLDPINLGEDLKSGIYYLELISNNKKIRTIKSVIKK